MKKIAKQLGFKKGQVDLKWDKFLCKLTSENASIGSELRKYHFWIEEVANYRDNIIHRHGVYIYQHPGTNSYGVPAKADFDPLYYMKIEAAELLGHYVSIGELCNDWVNNSDKIVKMVLGDLFSKF